MTRPILKLQTSNMEKSGQFAPEHFDELTSREEGLALLALDDESLDNECPEEKHRARRGIVARLSTLLIFYTLLGLDHLRRLALFLLPSFVYSRWIQPGAAVPPDPQTILRPTAYLDGLRGVAAWAVYNAHLSAVIDKSIGASWGYNGKYHSLYRLPIVRLLYKGDFAVALFFVISGFALSVAPVSIMRSPGRDSHALLRKLSSAAFRRPMRLFIPSWASTLIFFFAIRIGFFEILTASQLEFDKLLDGWPAIEHLPERFPSFFTQLGELIQCNLSLLHVFSRESADGYFPVKYNGVLWTIKLEFGGSMVLFLTQLALCFMHRRMRTGVTSGLIVAAFAVGAWDFPLFWAGYLIADFSPLSAAENKPTESMRSVLITAASWFTLVLGLLVGSFPTWQPQNVPAFAWMVGLTPASAPPINRLYVGIGAGLVLLAISKLPMLMRIYTTRPIQYLGKISFALYLVHGPIVQVLGTLVFYGVWSVTGKESAVATAFGFVIAYCILFGITVWAADVFWRCIDRPSVALSARMEKWFFKND